jgi:UDP:flavonoid glycosyltransferase YjiC (YdhE family)
VQAFYAERAGTGRVLSPERADADACREALSSLLAPGSAERGRARAIAEAWADRDGAREGARRIAALAG